MVERIKETITFHFDTVEQQQRFHERLNDEAPVVTRAARFTKAELMTCKRTTVVLAEAIKVAMGGKQAPLELRRDMQTLLAVLRRLEAIAE